MPGNVLCWSDPAMSIDLIHDYVTATVTGIEEINSNVSIYPNPTKGIVNITAEGIKNIMVMNALGQKVFETSENQIDLSKFGTGLFLIKVETTQGVSMQRVIIEK